MSNGKDENTVENGILALPETVSATGLFSMSLLIQPSDPRNRPLFPFDRTWSGPAEAISELLADHNLPLGTHHPKWLLRRVQTNAKTAGAMLRCGAFCLA